MQDQLCFLIICRPQVKIRCYIEYVGTIFKLRILSVSFSVHTVFDIIFSFTYF